MNKKISLGTAIGLMLISATLAIAITMSASSKVYNKLLKDLPEKIQTYSLLEEIGNIVKENYYGATDNDSIDNALADGYVTGLSDAYSRYMSADEYSKYDREIQGRMTGIGITYKKSGAAIVITKVYGGSPAEVSGLSKGDKIVAFDGEPITNDNYKSMVSKLEGDKLSTVNLTYKHGKEEKTISVAMGYEAQSVESQAVGQIGYIKILDFYSTTTSQVESALDKFISQGATGLVIDLRGNASTNFESAIKTLDLFVPTVEGTDSIATVIDSKGNILSKYTSDAEAVNLPIKVLIDGTTLGGAEILACDLRDFGKAELIGATTSGVGVMQKVFNLSDGSALLLSVGEIHPYKSDSYNNKGIKPDYRVKDTSIADEITQDTTFLVAQSLFENSGE